MARKLLYILLSVCHIKSDLKCVPTTGKILLFSQMVNSFIFYPWNTLEILKENSVSFLNLVLPRCVCEPNQTFRKSFAYNVWNVCKVVRTRIYAKFCFCLSLIKIKRFENIIAIFIYIYFFI